MLKNYIKIAFRNILKHKGHAFINIAGLAIGMAVCILITLWVIDELSFDRFHDRADRIYRLICDANVGGNALLIPISNAPAAPAMVSDFPEIAAAARIDETQNIAVQHGSAQFLEKDIFYGDNDIFKIFSFPIIRGDAQSPLAAPYTLVISEEIAEKYFGDSNPIGQTFRFDNEDEYTITAVMANIPSNSQLQFNMLASFETLYAENPEQMNQWISFTYYTYVLLEKGSHPKMLEAKFPGFVDKYMGKQLSTFGGTIKYLLQPLTDIHLYSNLVYDFPGNGNIAYVYLFAGIALFVLLIACCNFINLTTARSITRANEIAVRKTFGADKQSLIKQFLGEAVIYSILASLLALVIVELFLPVFNSISQRQLGLDRFEAPWIMAGFAVLAVLVGLLAGSYPALYLSSMRPYQILKGTTGKGRSRSRLRQGLVIGQFAISIVLIIGTLVVHSQINFMQNRDLGYAKEQILIIPDVQGQVNTVKTELKRVPGVLSVAAVSEAIGESSSRSVFVPEGFSEDQSQIMNYLEVDHDFISTLGIDIVSGRDFSPDFPSDTNDAVIINEMAARTFGWDDPVGKTIKDPDPTDSGMDWHERTVIGVVKDFHSYSLHYPIEPMYITPESDINVLVLRINAFDKDKTLAALKEQWSGIFPNLPFDYYFLDELFESMYEAEVRFGRITIGFGLLAILIACLGLFGLASYAAEQRTREIGIRKVLGASVSGILQLVTKEFILLVLIANIIAWPAAYFSMNKWLQDFAYRIDIGLGIFIISAAIAIIIALLTVSYQALRAARTNPAETLKYE
jgi:putative ABC transport system permease protein